MRQRHKGFAAVLALAVLLSAAGVPILAEQTGPATGGASTGNEVPFTDSGPAGGVRALMDGGLAVTGGIANTDYTYESGILTVKTGVPLVISGTTTTDRVVVAAGVRADVTLKDVSITSADNRPFAMEGAAVTLRLAGTNNLTAPDHRAAVFCPGGSELTIEGPGALHAKIGSKGGAAVIGGESKDGNSVSAPDYRDWVDGGDCGKITINGGTVNVACPVLVTSGYEWGAGIGGSSGGPVTINGGKVEAICDQNTVGIGSLRSEFEGILIHGGTVTAKTRYGDPFNDMGTNTSLGPAIGVVSGYVIDGVGVPITITGGTVDAQSNFGCAGIGGGRNGYGGIITIQGDARVTAKGGYGAAGIGGGYAQNGGGCGGVITIEGNAVINATGGENAAGIGGGAPRQMGANVGAQGDSGIITIAGSADVTAHGGVNAPGIGSGGSGVANGNFPDASIVQKIVITGSAKVNAVGGSGSVCAIGPGKLDAKSPPASERFQTFICTVPGVNTPVTAKNSLIMDGDGNYLVSGSVTLNRDFTVPAGKTLTIPENALLTVPQDVTLRYPTGAVIGAERLVNDGGTIVEGDGGQDDQQGAVTGVSVSPVAAEVQKGTAQQFTASVAGTGAYSKAVHWSVTGGVSGTKIDQNGLLTVDTNETASALTVRAVSAADDTKSGTAQVTVTAVPAARYALTVTGGTGSGDYAAGTTVRIAATVPAEKAFDHWQQSGPGTLTDANAQSTTFTIGAGSASVTAILKEKDSGGGDSSGSQGSSGSGGSGGGGSRGGLISGGTARGTAQSSAAKTSANVGSDGAVKAADVANAVSQAVAAAKKSGKPASASITVTNAKTVSPAALAEMANAAAKAGGTTQLLADTVVDGKITARLYISPEKAANLHTDINLAVSTEAKAVKPVSDLFQKYFQNSVSVVSLGQEGSFGMAVGVAVMADLTALQKDQLLFYAYDKRTNTYAPLKAPAYFIDTAGYLHFDTAVGGDIIITDKVLTAK